MKLKKTVFFLLLIMSQYTCGQKYSLNNFTQVPLPAEKTNEWSQLNWADIGFQVQNREGKLQIKKIVEDYKCKLDVKEGTLIGTDRGEWGGELKFKPHKGKEIVIMGGNIKSIFMYKGRIFLIEGLAHLSLNKGALYEIIPNGKSYEYKMVADLKDAPYAVCVYNEKLLIVASNAFFIYENSKLQTLYKDMFWWGMYPNSIAAIDDQNVYIGMRGGIVKLDMTNTENKFLYRYNDLRPYPQDSK
jgi:hypothetical protein